MEENTCGRSPEEKGGNLSKKIRATRSTVPFGRRTCHNDVFAVFSGQPLEPGEIGGCSGEGLALTKDGGKNTLDHHTGNGVVHLAGTSSDQTGFSSNKREQHIAQSKRQTVSIGINTSESRDMLGNIQGTLSDQTSFASSTYEKHFSQSKRYSVSIGTNTPDGSDHLRNYRGTLSDQTTSASNSSEKHFPQSKRYSMSIGTNTPDSSDQLRNYRDIRTPSNGSDHSYESGHVLRRHENLRPRQQSVPWDFGNAQRPSTNQYHRKTSVPANFVNEGEFWGDSLRRTHGTYTPADMLKDIVIDIKLKNETSEDTEVGAIVRLCNEWESAPDIIEVGLRHPSVAITKYCIVKATALIQNHCNYSNAEIKPILRAWSKCKTGKQNMTSSRETWLQFLVLTYNIVQNLVLVLGTYPEDFDDEYDILGKINFIRDETSKISKGEDKCYIKDMAFYTNFICTTLADISVIVSKVRPLLGQINSYAGNNSILKQGGFYKTFEKLDLYSQVILIKRMFIKVDTCPHFVDALQKCTAVYDGRNKLFKWNLDTDKENKALSMLLHKTDFVVERILANGKAQVLPLSPMKNGHKCDEYIKRHFLRVVTPLLFHSNKLIRDTMESVVSDIWHGSRSWIRTALTQIVESKLLPFLGNVRECNLNDERRGFLYYKGAMGRYKQVLCKVGYENTEEDDNNISTRVTLEKDILKAMSKASNSQFVGLIAESAFDTLPQLLVVYVEEEYMSLSEFLLGHLQSDERSHVKLDERLSIVLNVINIAEFCNHRHILLGAFTASNFMYDKLKRNVKMSDMTCAVRGSRDSDGHLKHTGNKSNPLPLLSAAPETVLKAQYSSCSEAYVLGHFMNEILSHGIQSHEERYDSTDTFTLFVQIHKCKWVPARRPGVPIALYEWLLQSIEYEPQKRIELPRLKGKVEEHLNTLASQSSRRKETSVIQGMRYLLNLAKRGHTPHNDIRYPPHNLRNLNSLEALVSNSSLCPDYEKENHDSALDTRQKTVSAVTIDELIPDDRPIISENEFREPMLRKILEEEQTFRNSLLELQHENVARILNFEKINDAKLGKIWTMVYKLEGSGSHRCLLEYYKSQKVQKKCNHYLQIAKGMEFLHSKGIVHGSLQAKFCYIFPATNQVKIGRLARSSQLQQTHQDSDIMDVMSYPHDGIQIDIKRFMPDEVFSMHSDIAMYGLLIYQLENARCPTEDETIPYYSVDLAKVKIFQKCGLKPYLSGDRTADKCDQFIEGLISICIQIPAHRRPLFSKLTDALGNNVLQRQSSPQSPLQSQNIYAILRGEPGSWPSTSSAGPYNMNETHDPTYESLRDIENSAM